MPEISEDELLRRRNSVASNLGTHAMEGIFPDATILQIMLCYECGELTPEQFDQAMDAHAHSQVAMLRPLASVA